jgi:hypothetical protein
MSSIQERCDWLREHLTYEVLMVRYAHEQLKAPIDTVGGQMRWNASFGAFALYARNLYDFLTNKAESGNFEAADYDRPAANGKGLEGIMYNLNQQVFHTGQQRKRVEGKVGREKATKVHDWIEVNLAKFIEGLNDTYKPHWDPDAADPSKLDLEAHYEIVKDDDPATSRPVTTVKNIF